jgi:hypothetical protein
MIVQNIGYLKIEDVNKMINDKINFSIYKTSKNTAVLVINSNQNTIDLFRAKQNRLPWKIVKGNKITYSAKKLFNSIENKKTELNTEFWNNNQIISYKETTFDNY